MLPFTEDDPNSLRNACVGPVFFDTTKRKYNFRLNTYYVTFIVWEGRNTTHKRK
jgi:hypothetical protein